MKESDQASQERLEALRREIATAQEDLDKRKAEWQNEKDAIEHVQNLKSDLEGAQLEEERATREGDLVKAPRSATRAFPRCSSSCMRPRKS